MYRRSTFFAFVVHFNIMIQLFYLIVIYLQVLIITTNANTKQRLESASKDAHVVILSAEQTADDDQYFSHVGYLKLLVRRTQLLNLLIQHDFETFLFEFDFLWIKNPIPLLHSYNNQYDMLFIENYYEPNSMIYLA
jgi:hypothetical protein